ncbi:Hypothetical predicted protein [Olea europaea subsp. europaea]|uniref:DUF1985 domain-containing protein n=1 Tax=Olea europaea subsp. europaea TaxID=158383 RepID=A0A8S0PZS7_OLEEU|nr:Hypothetical predicted protein [Olea europaea subsp. europaea]
MMDHFDERQWEDFRNSSLGYLVEEYALVTGLRCGTLPEGAEYERLLERRRLKERYFKSNDKISLAQLQIAMARSSTPRADRYKLGLVLILEGVFNAPDNNVDIHLPTLLIVDDLDYFLPTFGVGSDIGICCTDSGEDEITYTVHGFSISMQVWTHEALPEVGKYFAQRVGERLPRFLRRSARKQPQHCTYDAFFKNVKLHVYSTLRPIDAEAQQPYFSTLVPSRDSGHVAREDSDKEASEGGSSEEHTSGGDKEKGASGSGPDGEDILTSSTVIDLVSMSTPVEEIGVSLPHLGRRDVEELFLDQRILFEMRFWTVKLEILQYVSSEFTSLRDFLAILMARASLTTAAVMTGTETEASVSGSLPEDVYGGPTESCLNEQDIPIDTGNMQNASHIALYQDDVNQPLAAASEEVQDARATEPSNAPGMTMKRRRVAMRWMAMVGIRSAMSLIDKLISFMCIDKCSLIPRIFGFVFMVLLLWSPVAKLGGM